MIEREWEKSHFSRISLSTTRVRQRLCNLMGTDVIRLNDKRYFQKLSTRLQEEYESEMDKEEDARMASENERLRRLMLEGVIENPHDYRAIIHGEHTQHRRTKKKKRSKRKKRPESSQGTDNTKTVTSQGSEEERDEDEEVVTQVEYLTRPGSSVGISSAKTKKTSARKDRKTGVDQRDDGEKENNEEKRFAEMHVPPPHRPSSSCSLRRKRLKSAAPRVSHWDQSSSESSDADSDPETKSLPEPRPSRYQWRYSKKEKPLVKTLRKEETVAGLYAIAEELISPIKTEETSKKSKRPV